MNKNSPIFLFVPILVIYILGMFLDIMEIDAAQYASISREMLQSGSYLELYDHGRDYLDKPPLLFWVSALSFKLFGISNFSYKLPSVLFSLLGIWATYRLGKALYGKSTGVYAALILSTCQAWFLMNQDVKTDTILAACTVFAIWQLQSYLTSQKLMALLAASVGIAGAMLTKGPIGIMIPALAVGSHLLVQRDWKKIFQWQWLIVPVVVLICLSPMMWGLYQQYDQHPGKLIGGVPIKSGLTFYFWTQSFGRITGQNVWKDDTTPLYFMHTFLWAFAPWCLFFVWGLWNKTKQLAVAKFGITGGEALTWGGFILPFAVLSLSHYKLPHYIFPLFPMAAIIAAKYLSDVVDQPSNVIIAKRWRYVQFFLTVVIFILVFLLCRIAFPIQGWLFWSNAPVFFAIACFFMWRGKSAFQQIVMPSLVAMLTFNFFLNVHVYHALFRYQSTNVAARFAKDSPEGAASLVGYRQQRASLDFYARRTVPDYQTVDELVSAQGGKTIWVYTDEPGYKELKDAGIKITEVKDLDHYHISKLTMNFLNPATRPAQVQRRHLLRVSLSSESR